MKGWRERETEGQKASLSPRLFFPPSLFPVSIADSSFTISCVAMIHIVDPGRRSIPGS
jgi:hypothetical protein